MSGSIIMPQLGETVAEGKIIAWFKSVGDTVAVGDRLFEVETDKVTVEVEAIEGGTLTDIRIGKDVTAKVGTVVAVLDGGAAAMVPKPAIAPSAKPSAPALSAFEEVRTATGSFGKSRASNDVRVSPLARRLIAQNGFDIESVAATALKENVRRIDQREVSRLMQQTSSSAVALRGPSAAAVLAPLPLIGGEIVTLNTIRQRTGDRLAENWRTIPHVFQAIEADFTAVEAARADIKARFKAEQGVSLTFLPFIARAVCLALDAFPQVNARFDGKALELSRDVNLGIAVDLNHNGLVVPVIRQAGDLTTLGLAKAVARMVERARSGKLGADDLTGGTYSISNNGAFGTLFTAPIINAPQVAILSVDAICKRPAIVETPDGDFVAARLIGMIGQSFDHRAFDGAYSAAYLSKLKSIIETRNWAEDLASGRAS
jgi:pyruvate/2-oxoglutarate dehydrogenase complex dihydrolipoamide acyltransferase (E2) component